MQCRICDLHRFAHEFSEQVLCTVVNSIRFAKKHAADVGSTLFAVEFNPDTVHSPGGTVMVLGSVAGETIQENGFPPFIEGATCNTEKFIIHTGK